MLFGSPFCITKAWFAVRAFKDPLLEWFAEDEEKSCLSFPIQFPLDDFESVFCLILTADIFFNRSPPLPPCFTPEPDVWDLSKKEEDPLLAL